MPEERYIPVSLPTPLEASINLAEKKLGEDKAKLAHEAFYVIVQPWQKEWLSKHTRPIITQQPSAEDIQTARKQLAPLRPPMLIEFWDVFELLQNDGLQPQEKEKRLDVHREFLFPLLDKQEEISEIVGINKIKEGKNPIDPAQEETALNSLVQTLIDQRFINEREGPRKTLEKIAFTTLIYKFLANESKNAQIVLKQNVDPLNPSPMAP